ncbi:MAG: HEAT repeat domain-containing protein [Steroidobacteraceae bacterium]|nr:HEAT repeat domain-containing protein [Steroidobacteraceae bacterium]
MKPSVLLSRLFVFSFSALAGLAAAQTLPLNPDPRLATPTIQPASDDAQLALKRFTLPAGMQAKLWAAEPMLANPVAFDIDEKGRVFVAETYRYGSSVLDIRGYMGMLELDMALRTIEDRAAMNKKVFGEQAKELAVESEILRLVEDTNGDGLADKSSVFADGFNHELDGIASGVLARHGQVWFTNIPSLYRFDEKAGGKPAKEELLRGFGVRYNYTGHDFHGLAIGHDGKLYYSIGDRGSRVKGKEGQTIDYPDEGVVFRSNLDGTELEVVARGLRNPQELVFDEHGNLFTGDNDSDQGDMERLVYLVEGGDSGWRVGYQHAPRDRGGPWIRESLWKPRFDGRPAYLLPPVCNIEDGPSGLTYYPGSGLESKYKGHFFLTHFKGSIARSGIQTYTLKEDGATFVPTSSQQFMGGVLPTDVMFGPDGKLWISDWVDGWPKPGKGRMYSISPEKPDAETARVSAELAKILAAGFKQRKDAELVSLLAHPDRRARLEAQLELASRGSRSVGLFTKVVTNKAAAPLARLHAVWGLTQLGRGKDGDKVAPTLGKLLTDTDAEVRAQAAKGLGDISGKGGPGGKPDVAARVLLEKALVDSAPRVQFFAAQSLGKLGDAASTPPLLALLERNADKDAYLRHAASYALSKIGRNDALDAAAKSPSKAVRLGVLLTYRHLELPRVAQFLVDSDAYLVREAAEAINDADITNAVGPLAGKLSTATPSDEPLVERALNANYRLGGAERAQALANYATNDKASPEMRAEALLQLGLWGKTPQRDRIVGVFRPLPARDGKDGAAALSSALPKVFGATPEPVQVAALEAVKTLELSSASPVLVAAVANPQVPADVRAGALQLLDSMNAKETQDAIAAAEKSGVPALRLAALEIVARRTPDRALPIIQRLIADGSDVEQRAAFVALGQLQRPEAPRMLVTALDQLAAGKIKPGAQLELVETAEKSTAPAVKARWEKQKAAWDASKDPLAPYSFALAGGDPRRGAGQFFGNAVLPCARCHVVGSDGGEAGPNLSRIGKEKTPEYLLESIIKPSAHIAAGFDIVTLQLANGETETGSIARESPTQIVLKRADGTSATFDVKQVKQRTVAPSSMPEIYGQVMTREQLRDVVAFLLVLDGSGPSGEKGFGEANRAMSKVTTDSRAGGH